MNPTGEWPYPSGLPGWPGGENGNGMVSQFFYRKDALFFREFPRPMNNFDHWKEILMMMVFSTNYLSFVSSSSILYPWLNISVESPALN